MIIPFSFIRICDTHTHIALALKGNVATKTWTHCPTIPTLYVYSDPDLSVNCYAMLLLLLLTYARDVQEYLYWNKGDRVVNDEMEHVWHQKEKTGKMQITHVIGAECIIAYRIVRYT